MKGLLKVDSAEWVEAVAGQEDFLKSYGRRMPKAMWDEHEALARRIDDKVTARLLRSPTGTDSGQEICETRKKIARLAAGPSCVLSQIPFLYRHIQIARLSDRILLHEQNQNAAASSRYKDLAGVIHVHTSLGGHSTATLEELRRLQRTRLCRDHRTHRKRRGFRRPDSQWPS